LKKLFCKKIHFFLSIVPMGNFCKTLGQPNYKSSQYNNKRVNHEEIEDPNFKGFCAAKLKAKVKKVGTANQISASEFLRICSQNRPKGVSDYT